MTKSQILNTLRNKRLWILVLLPLITLVGFKLRSDRGTIVPLPGQSTDEYSNAWVGMSLIQTGMPVGISGLSAYTNQDPRYINVDRMFSSGASTGNPMAINYPWFDHPPLMPLVVGGYAHLKGARVFEDASVGYIRKPAIILGTLLIPLVFWLAFQEFGLGVAVLASLIIAVSPLMVINSRMSQAEAGIALLFVLNLIWLNYYFKTKNRLYLWLAAVSGGGAVLFKLSGVVVALSGLVLLWMKTKKLAARLQDSLVLLSPTLAGLVFFLAYGFSLDPHQFWAVFASNAGRKYGIGLNAVYELITQTRVTALKYLTDGWFLVGWLGLASLFSKKNGMGIKLAVISYLAIYLLFGSAPFGWYRIPFLPFLGIAAAYLIITSLKDPKLFPLGALALLTTIGVNLGKLFTVDDPQTVFLFRWGNVLLLLAILALYVQFATKPKWARKISIVIILALTAIALASSLWFTQSLTLDAWYKIT